MDMHAIDYARKARNVCPPPLQARTHLDIRYPSAEEKISYRRQYNYFCIFKVQVPYERTLRHLCACLKHTTLPTPHVLYTDKE